VKRDLPCKLTDKELIERGSKLASLQTEIDAKQAEKTAISAAQKPLKKESRAIVRVLKNGTEVREVACEKRIFESSNEVAVVRLDTNEEVERRTLSFEERQGDFFAEAGDHVEEGRKDKKSKPEKKSKGGKHLRSVK
jgi:hypothetical protein